MASTILPGIPRTTSVAVLPSSAPTIPSTSQQQQQQSAVVDPGQHPSPLPAGRQRCLLEASRKSSSVFTSNVRVMHPNADMIIRAIVADDVLAFARELVITNPTPEQLARKKLPPGTGYVSDASPDEENAAAKYFLQKDTSSDCAHLAAANDAFGILNFIVRMKNADLKNNQTSDTGWTPLHFAAFNQSERICALLRSNGADLFVEDIYGDRPCDIAVMFGNRALAERLGDTSCTAETSKKDQAYQQLLAQAKAYEEERAREALEQRRLYEERVQLDKERRRVLEERRKLKAAYENERLLFMRERWLSARQSFVRDFLTDQWQKWVESTEKAIVIDSAACAKAAADRIARENLARQREIDAQRKKGKKGDRRGSKGKAKKSAAGQGLVLAATAADGAAVDASSLDRFLSSLEEEPLPEISDRMTKDQKAAVVKQRNKMIKEIKIRREEAARMFQEQQATHYNEQDALEEECLSSREEIEQQWFSAFGNISCYDPSADRRHAGFFRYEPFDDRYRWSCCGQIGNPFALGCLPAEDRTRTMIHSGAFTFHMQDCPCGGLLCVGAGAEAAASPPHPAAASKGNGTITDAADEFSRASDRLSGFTDVASANRQERNQRRVGPKSVKFCNPGGCCWSCCGATVQRGAGCTPQFRFLFADHMLCDVRFLPADPAATITQLVATEADERSLSLQESGGRPSSPIDVMSIRLEERSQAVVTSLIPPDPELVNTIAFVIGDNGVSIETETDRDALQQDAAEIERVKYSHALRKPQGPFYTTSKGVVRISNGGRTVEHLTPPLTSRKTTRRIGPSSTLPLQARVTRTNLLGNVVLKGDFLADVRRGDADGTAAMESLQSYGSFTSFDDDGDSEDDAGDAARHNNGSHRHDDDAAEEGRAEATAIGSPDPRMPGWCAANTAVDPSELFSGMPMFASRGELPSEHPGDHAAYAFEVRITACPIPISVSDERMVIGLVQAELPPDDELQEGVDSNNTPLGNDYDDEDDEPTMVVDADEEAVAFHADGAFGGNGQEGSVELTMMAAGSVRSLKNSRARRTTTRMHEASGEEPSSNESAMEAAREAYRRRVLANTNVPGARKQRAASVVTFEGGALDGGDDAAFDAKQSFTEGPRYNAGKFASSSSFGGSDDSSLNGNALQSCFSAVLSARRHAASIFKVSRRTRAYVAREGSYISGPYGIGWWAYSNSLRGLGVEHELPEESVLQEGDLVTFVVDGMNNLLHLFHNRSFCHSVRLPEASTTGYVPAVTLVAGCRIDVEYVGTRLPYILKWWREKAIRERMLRLTISPKLLDAKLTAIELAKRQSGIRGAGGGAMRRVGSTVSSSSGAGSMRRMRHPASSSDARSASETLASEEFDAEIRY